MTDSPESVAEMGLNPRSRRSRPFARTMSAPSAVGGSVAALLYHLPPSASQPVRAACDAAGVTWGVVGRGDAPHLSSPPAASGSGKVTPRNRLTEPFKMGFRLSGIRNPGRVLSVFKLHALIPNIGNYCSIFNTFTFLQN